MTGSVDVLVVGAGIHGAGVAQAAAAAGYRVRVIEKTGIASGTSCRSSKLIHGGLRYLESGQYRLVRESLRERELLLRLAPKLVRRVPFHIPVYRDHARSVMRIRMGLMLYSLFGDFRNSARFESIPRRAWSQLDGLETRGLRKVFRYFDAQTDDAALTNAVLKSARSMDTEILVPAEFLGATRVGNGWRVRYRASGIDVECNCHVLVNAAGPWVNQVLDRIEPTVRKAEIDLVQGSHIVVDGGLTQGAYYVEADDRRALFVLPWRGGLTMIGTTETAHRGEPSNVQPTGQEVEYLLTNYRRCFPQRDIDIRDRFAGLRVLPRAGGSALNRSRETLYLTDSDKSPRLVSIVGGKLTCYRLTANRVVEMVSSSLPTAKRRGLTGEMPLE